MPALRCENAVDAATGKGCGVVPESRDDEVAAHETPQDTTEGLCDVQKPHEVLGGGVPG